MRTILPACVVGICCIFSCTNSGRGARLSFVLAQLYVTRFRTFCSQVCVFYGRSNFPVPVVGWQVANANKRTISRTMLGRRLFPASRSVRALSTFERVRVSSIPAINEAVSSNVKSPTYLIEHPFPLDGYREKPHVTPVEQSVFAIVDHSGTQYKVVEVSALGIAFSGD
jgi:hypothetical protein